MRRFLALSALLLVALSVTQIRGDHAAVETPAGIGKIGVVYHWWTPGTTAESELASFRRLKALGIDWIRWDASWANFEDACKRCYSWAVMDRVNANLRTAGLKSLALVGSTPEWAREPCSTCTGELSWIPPRNMDDYADAVRAYLERYPDTAAVEIWNEPWHGGFWKPVPEPARYAEMVTAGARAAKDVHPSIPVIASGDLWMTEGAEGEFFRPMLTELTRRDPEIGEFVDGWSVHPYSEARPPEDTTAEPEYRYSRGLITRRIALELGVPEAIWQTEFGWSSAEPPSRQYPATDEELQAQYTVRALELAHGSAGWGYEGPSMIYVWGPSEGPTVNNRLGQYGMLRADWTEKPVVAAVASLRGYRTARAAPPADEHERGVR